MKTKQFHPRMNYYSDFKRVECLWAPGDVYYETISEKPTKIILIRRTKDKEPAGIIVQGVTLTKETAELEMSHA